jgi:hypothetical protein
MFLVINFIKKIILFSKVLLSMLKNYQNINKTIKFITVCKISRINDNLLFTSVPALKNE